ncbi:MAG: MerR family transcriptional regulator [Peptococcaceae bacterium]|nr:MerR family transcriptional regulator [Peptococcaceae bacterium]MDH7525367.1 MerR family transcriptional regulator [Peptococcaceae bacterium]
MKRKLTVKEVAQILQVEESTIRFWEREFGEYLQVKAQKGQRNRYTPENLEMLGKIRELLHTEMYTIKGARRRLELDRAVGDSLGVEHNFKTTVLFMFSNIMDELQRARGEAQALSCELQELKKTKNRIETQLEEIRGKKLFGLFRIKG